MFKSVSIEKNIENLRYVSNKLLNIEWFIFFGTLLGYTREKNILKNDDDIDIYVNIKSREAILDLFYNTEIMFDLTNKPNLGPYFLQGTRLLENEITYIDFYFYENDTNNSFIKEKNNFSGAWKVETNTMHVPIDIIYPIQKAKLKDIKIFVPYKPIDCCEFLYGKDWKIPLSKSVDYFIDIINNKPMLIKKNNLKIKI